MNLVNVSMEAIGFQGPDVAKKMHAFVVDILSEHNAKDADSCKAHKNLTKYLKDLTGMNIKIVFDTDIPPATLPVHINPDTILGDKTLKDFYVETAKNTLERLKNVKSKSYIDLKNGKVGGIFSEMESPIYMSWFALKALRWNAREIAAAIAHEVGHSFVAYELAFRTTRTNQILAAVSKAAAGGDKGVYEYVLKTSEDVMDLKSGVFDELVDCKDQKTIMTVVMGKIEEKTRADSLMGNATYDITSFEALADQYAVRLGFGKDLVTALDKLTNFFGGSEYSQPTRIAMTFVDLFKVAGIIGGVLVMTAAPFMASFYLAIVGTILYSRLDGREHNNVYDKLSIRYKRIKEQMIQYLKDTKLPAQEVKNTLESIALVERNIGEISEYKGFLIEIFNFIDPASRAVINARDVQQKLETIVANDMYLKAAQLRSL